VLDNSLPDVTAVAGIVTGADVAFTTTPAATGGVWYDFGDGTWDFVNAPGTTTHSYAKKGTYTAKASQNGSWVSTTVTTTVDGTPPG
jgi:hypothetical protein